MRAWRTAPWLALALLPAAAAAHSTSTGLATLDARTEAMAYVLTLAPAELGDAGRDLARAAGGDADAAARWGATLQQQLALQVDERPCRVRRLRLQGEGAERVGVRIDWACPAVPGRLRLDDRLWQSFGEHHRSIVSLTLPGGERVERVLDRDQPSARLDAATPVPASWADFIALGVQHILSGADHLLFLVALLVGTSGWRALALSATAFTLAHSLSLALAVLGTVSASPAWVEPAIAASIVWVALENLWWPGGGWRRHALAFAFGLVHGLGFAGALTELQLQGVALVRALVGFNLGVELGQLAVIAALWPLLAWLGRRPQAKRWMRAASWAAAAAGVAWLVQRLA
ncbi:MAG: HupE/UreJ family protein [Rubrivivax sp.]